MSDGRLEEHLYGKIMLGMGILIICVNIITFFLMQAYAKDALLQTTRDDLGIMMDMILHQFTPEEIEGLVALKPGDETSKTYQELIDKMHRIRNQTPNVINIYTLKRTGDRYNFIVDDFVSENVQKLPEDYPTLEQAMAGRALIGQIYEEPPEELAEAWDRRVVTEQIYSDEFGNFLSAFAPLKDSQGNTIAIIGIDTHATNLMHRQRFTTMLTYLDLIIGSLLAISIISYFTKNLVKDILKLKHAFDTIGKGQRANIPILKRNDELGRVAKSAAVLIDRWNGFVNHKNRHHP